jgi:hypothetical protein
MQNATALMNNHADLRATLHSLLLKFRQETGHQPTTLLLPLELYRSRQDVGTLERTAGELGLRVAYARVPDAEFGV